MAEDIVDPFDITGRDAQKEAEHANKKNISKALVTILEGTEGSLEDHGLSIEQFQGALDLFKDGFPDVMGELDAVGESSLQSAFDEYQGRLGDGDQDLIGSGRFGTSARESLQGGERSRYIRDVASINEGLGQLRSNVRLQGLGAISGLMQGLGGAYERRGNVTERGAFKRADFRGGVQYQAPPSMLSQAASTGASLAPLFSDRRLKTNIKRVGSVNGHNWYVWDWADHTGRGEGVIAQEIERTRPDLVYERDGFLAVDYGGL